MINIKLIVLENISDADITNYPIAEPELSSGEVRYDGNGNIISTGRTLLWTITSGEKKAFPEYVAKCLLKIYGVEDKDSGRSLLKIIEEREEAQEVVGEFVCKKCGKSFKGDKGLALHFASKHPELLK